MSSSLVHHVLVMSVNPGFGVNVRPFFAEESRFFHARQSRGLDFRMKLTANPQDTVADVVRQVLKSCRRQACSARHSRETAGNS